MPSQSTDANIQLQNSPLLEAWLEIRWQLVSSKVANPDLLIDPMYRFAIGNFYSGVKHEFPLAEPLPASQAPEGLLPHIPQTRFRPEKDGSPLLQLGPGVATVNFIKQPYSWHAFKEKALFLR